MARRPTGPCCGVWEWCLLAWSWVWLHLTLSFTRPTECRNCRLNEMMHSGPWRWKRNRRTEHKNHQRHMATTFGMESCSETDSRTRAPRTPNMCVKTERRPTRHLHTIILSGHGGCVYPPRIPEQTPPHVALLPGVSGKSLQRLHAVGRVSRLQLFMVVGLRFAPQLLHSLAVLGALLVHAGGPSWTTCTSRQSLQGSDSRNRCPGSWKREHPSIAASKATILANERDHATVTTRQPPDESHRQSLAARRLALRHNLGGDGGLDVTVPLALLDLRGPMPGTDPCLAEKSPSRFR